MENCNAPKIITDLLEAAKTAAGVTADNGLAVRIGWHRQMINQYRVGTKPSNENLLILCEMAGWDFHKTVIEVERAFAKTDEAKQRWDNLFRQLGGLAASVFVTVVTTTIWASEKAIQLALLSARHGIKHRYRLV